MNAPVSRQFGGTARRLAWVGIALCVLVLLLEWPVHNDPEFHPHFALEAWWGFFAGLSLIACLSLAGLAWLWRPVAHRLEEDSRD